jgi:hypothetical protein
LLQKSLNSRRHGIQPCGGLVQPATIVASTRLPKRVRVRRNRVVAIESAQSNILRIIVQQAAETFA